MGRLSRRMRMLGGGVGGVAVVAVVGEDILTFQ